MVEFDLSGAPAAGVDLRLVGYNDNARLGEIPGRAFVKNSVYARKNGKVQLAFDPKIAFPNAAGNFGSFQVEVDVVGEGDPLIDRDEYVILDLVNGTKLVMKRIRAKDVVWTMGPAENDSRAMDSTYWSHPQMGESRVQVKLTKDYFMGIFELSQTQYKTLTGENPSFFTNVNSSALYPVENVPLTWSAMETKLKTRHDFGFRIPTEAQWEFAARAGYEGVGLPNGKMPESSMSGSTPVWSNLQELEGFAYSVGNTDRNVQTVVLSVGSGRPNAYGLYNTLCNVSAWVVDKPQRNLAGYYASSSKPVEDPRSTTAEGMYGNSYGMLKGGNFRQVQWWRYATRLATPDGQATYNGQPAWGWRLCADAE